MPIPKVDRMQTSVKAVVTDGYSGRTVSLSSCFVFWMFWIGSGDQLVLQVRCV